MRKAVTEHSIVAARLSGQVFAEQAAREGGLAAYQNTPPAFQAAVKAANSQQVDAITTLSAGDPSKASALRALALKAPPSIATSTAGPAVAAFPAQAATQIVRDALTAAPSQATTIASAATQAAAPGQEGAIVAAANQTTGGGTEGGDGACGKGGVSGIPPLASASRAAAFLTEVVAEAEAAARQSRSARTDPPHLRR